MSRLSALVGRSACPVCSRVELRAATAAPLHTPTMVDGPPSASQALAEESDRRRRKREADKQPPLPLPKKPRQRSSSTHSSGVPPPFACDAKYFAPDTLSFRLAGPRWPGYNACTPAPADSSLSSAARCRPVNDVSIEFFEPERDRQWWLIIGKSIQESRKARRRLHRCTARAHCAPVEATADVRDE